MKVRAAVLESGGRQRPFAESRPIAIAEVELQGPGPGELLVCVHAAGVCHSDLSVVDGNRPRPLPMVLGHEAAGVVEAVGEGVRDVGAGDHVVLTFVPSCGSCAACTGGEPTLCEPASAANAEGRLLGGGRRFRRGDEELHHHLGVSAFAERTVVARGSAVVVPPDIPLDVAALLGCATVTGVGAVLNTARLRPGESAAVFGLGGVGLAAVLGAALAGAQPLVVVDPIEAKRALALEVGATHAFTPHEAVGAIREVTGGGVTYAFEAAGHPAVLAAAYSATRRGGTTVTMGLPHPDAELTLSPLSLVAEARTLVGSYMGSAVPQRDIPAYAALWRAGRLPVDRLKTHELALDQVNEAMDALAGGEVVRQLIRP